MTSENTLKIYKFLCYAAYVVGLAWYPLEHLFQGKETAQRKVTLAYKLYGSYIVLHTSFTVACQLGALLFLDLPQSKVIMAIQFSFGDMTVIGKQIMLLVNSKIIYEIVNDIVYKLPSVYNNDKFTVQAANSSIKLTILMSVLNFCSVICMLVDDLIDFLKDTSRRYGPWPIYWPFGDGFWMTVLYYLVPNFGILLVVVTFWIADCLIVSTLIHLAMRFRQIQNYLANLDRICQEKMERFGKRLTNVDDSVKLSYDEHYKTVYREELFRIIKLHGATLKCASKVQEGFSACFLMQLIQGLVMIMPTLVKVLLDRTVTSYALGFSLILTLLFSLGTYTSNAGNVSYEAREVSESIYATNWYQYPELKPYMVVFIARAQRPLIFYCGGLIEVSHQTFVSICRASYSVFAIIF